MTEQVGIKLGDTLGRLYTVHPNDFDCLCLHLRLHLVKILTSFQALRMVNQQQYTTFQEACSVGGLLEDVEHWNATLEEAAVSHLPLMLRNLLAIVMVSCTPGNPTHLWDSHKESLAEDVLLQACRMNPGQEVHFNDAIFNEALILLEDNIIALGGKELPNCGLPTPACHQQISSSRELLRETSYNHEELAECISRNEPFLVQDQNDAFCTILEHIHSGSDGIIFLDAPGGTGKTFFLNLLLAKV